MQEKESMYVPNGVDEGRIEDQKVAREVANLEDTARTREKELARQHETGSTPEEERNLEIMRELRERYPGSLHEIYYDGGKLALSTYSTLPFREEENYLINWEDYEILLTKGGQFFVHTDNKPISKEDVNAVEREFRKHSDRYYEWVSIPIGEDKLMGVKRVDFEIGTDKGAVGAMLRSAAKHNKSKEIEERKPEIDELLEGI